MTQITLYTGFGVTFSTQYVEGRTESNYVRLIADDGKILNNGEISTSCIDVPKNEVSFWEEISYEEDIDDSEALSIMLGEETE